MRRLHRRRSKSLHDRPWRRRSQIATIFSYNSGRTSAFMHPAFAYTSRDEIARLQQDALAGRNPAAMEDEGDLPDILNNSMTDRLRPRWRTRATFQTYSRTA
jgi:hypothetical protein